MPRPRHYADAAAKQRAYRRRQQFQASVTGKLIALQEEAAQEHVGWRGQGLWLTPHATDEQLQLQTAAKERDMLDALWLLQTLIADFGYDEVHTHVLQHVCSCGAGGLCRTPSPERQADPP
jgi:hypothetical protein